jgi:riboflavin kinase
LHDYPSDFYGLELRVVILGFIRPEYNYAGLGEICSSHARSIRTARRADYSAALRSDALIDDINTDKRVAFDSAQREAYSVFKRDSFFTRPSVLGPVQLDQVDRKGEASKTMQP